MDQSQNKMGTQKIVPLIFSMALPAMISMLISALYNIVDSIFVAKYSQDALTAVSLVFPLQQLVIAIAVGTGVGVNSLIARRLGARMQSEADNAAKHGVALSVVSGIVFVFIGFFLSRPFLAAFTNRASVLEQAVQYSHIAVGLSIFVMISIMCEKIQQATGNMIIPMVQGLTGAIFNIILDPLMIFGIGPFPEMGIRGAAIATIVGQIFGMFVGIWGAFCHQKVVDVRMRGFRWEWEAVREIYRVGLPGIIMQSISSVMVSVMNLILITFSEVAVAVLGIYFKLQTFVFMPVFGLNQGALPVMAFNYGAHNRHRLMSAYRVSLIAAFSIMIAGLAVFQLLPEQMLMLFADTNDAAATATLLELGTPALRIISLSFPSAAFGIITSTIFQAIGRGVASLIVSVARQLLAILPAAWLLGKLYGLTAIWFSFPIAEVIAVILSAVLLYHAYHTELRFLETPKTC